MPRIVNSCTTYLLPKFHRHKLDPIGFGGGDDNLYRYVGNSTPNLRDPSGLSAQETAEASGDDEGPVFLDPADDTTSEMVQGGPKVGEVRGDGAVFRGYTIGN